MPIQFVCTECGQWMQAAEEEIGLAAGCPQCGESVPVPEESDRLVAEGACFYCGEPADPEELLEQAYSAAPGNGVGPSDPPTCAACRESIAENDFELKFEQERMRQFSSAAVSLLKVAGVLAIIVVLIMVLSGVLQKLLSNGQAPREPAQLVHDHGSAAAFTGWLRVPGDPVRAE